MSTKPATERPVDLQKLAEEVKVVAEVTADPNGKRALRFVALGYARLAEFARTTATESADHRKGQSQE
jgi:hypothetical protein